MAGRSKREGERDKWERDELEEGRKEWMRVINNEVIGVEAMLADCSGREYHSTSPCTEYRAKPA